MLNIKIRNKITVPEYRLLYDSKFNMTDPTIKKILQQNIKNIRRTFVRAGTDPLESKLKNFGNEGGWYKNKCIELTAMLYDPDKITVSNENETIGKWRSIEFELIFKSEKDMNEFANEVRQNGYGKSVVIKDDGSLRADDDDRKGLTKEVAVSYMSGVEKIIYDVCQAMRKHAYINNSCGTHVHFDMRGVDNKVVQQYGRRLARCVPALKALLPEARRNNRFCANTINSIKPERRQNGGPNPRYSFINMQAFNKYETIEVRGHSGTLNADKILSWIKICEIIMTTRIRSKLEEITDPLEMIKIFQFNEQLTRYITERFNKFNPREATPIAIVE